MHRSYVRNSDRSPDTSPGRAKQGTWDRSRTCCGLSDECSPMPDPGVDQLNGSGTPRGSNSSRSDGSLTLPSYSLASNHTADPATRKAQLMLSRFGRRIIRNGRMNRDSLSRRQEFGVGAKPPIQMTAVKSRQAIRASFVECAQSGTTPELRPDTAHLADIATHSPGLSEAGHLDREMVPQQHPLGRQHRRCRPGQEVDDPIVKLDRVVVLQRVRKIWRAVKGKRHAAEQSALS